jgi:hypothetical protein
MVTRQLTDVVQLSKIRMREATRKKLVREAEKNQRTLNAEIVARLAETLEDGFKRNSDAAVVQTLAGPESFNAELLRWIVYEIQGTKSRWWRSQEGIDNLVARLGEVVREVASPVSPKSGHRGKDWHK